MLVVSDNLPCKSRNYEYELSVGAPEILEICFPTFIVIMHEQYCHILTVELITVLGCVIDWYKRGPDMLGAVTAFRMETF